MDVKEKEKNLALKVERALKSMSRDFQEEDEEDCNSPLASTWRRNRYIDKSQQTQYFIKE